MRLIARPTTLLLVAAALACDDPFAAFLRPVPQLPTEVTIVDFRTGALNESPAFDAIREVVARVDQTNQWDFLFFMTEAGDFQLRPFGAVTELETEAGLQLVATTFDGLRMAPEDGYLTVSPIEVQVGDVLAVQSRRDPTFSGRCRRYAKIEILEIDAAAATLTFHHLVNPNCEDRVLVPGEHGTL